MKNLYNTPIVTIEELEKKDVLCASGDIDPTKYDNAASSGEGTGENDLGGMSNVI